MHSSESHTWQIRNFVRHVKMLSCSSVVTSSVLRDVTQTSYTLECSECLQLNVL